VAPALIELDRARELQQEVFGPVLHVVRWRAEEIDALLDDIAANGTALTLGIHSRIDLTIERIAARLPHGNVYVNRNMIGAVVGTQPFGGTGLSGTGPKAGGPDYLRRFATEEVVTVNTAAAGGNAGLLAQDE
jgi:RHH-type proline utilization regulon transcriptional repressor/proline dehydrogenase/delta 1-pyrroline-5-carboxylate dehydrogenase